MTDYLYYRRGEEWARVTSDSYSRKSNSNPLYYPGGQCLVDYRIFFTVDQINDKGVYVNTLVDRSIGQFVKGPIWSVEIRDEKRRVISIGPNGITATFRPVNSTYTLMNLRNIKIPRRDGLADSCGDSPYLIAGDCQTIFKKNGSAVLTLDSCPEVSDGRGCSECCGQLVAIAKQIKI